MLATTIHTALTIAVILLAIAAALAGLLILAGTIGMIETSIAKRRHPTTWRRKR